MKIAIISCLILTGCALASPQRHVAQLDPKSPKYETAECAAARKAAMDYDEKMAQRIAMGAGLGHIGPVGIVAAMKIDADQAKLRDAAKAEVDKACK